MDCYDELGARYQLPVYVLSMPTNMMEETGSAAELNNDDMLAANSGQEFDPWEEEPARYPTKAGENGIEQIVQREVAGYQEGESPKFSQDIDATTPERPGKDEQTDYKEEFPHEAARVGGETAIKKRKWMGPEYG